MKNCIIILVSAMVFSCTFALPAGTPNNDAEIVPTRTLDSDEGNDDGFKRGFNGVIDTGLRYPFFQQRPHSFGFNFGAIDSFEDIFRRLRTNIFGSSELPSISGSDIGFSGDKKGKTTSTVKVINGHKVEVNETVYGEGDNIFKVRVVNIRPVSDEDENVDIDENPVTDGPSSSPSKSKEFGDSTEDRREPLENHHQDNEIQGNIDDPEVKF